MTSHPGVCSGEGAGQSSIITAIESCAHAYGQRRSKLRELFDDRMSIIEDKFDIQLHRRHGLVDAA